MLLILVLSATTAAWVLVHRDKGGPSRCMGCGKCDKSGVCVLSGKQVRKETAPR